MTPARSSPGSGLVHSSFSLIPWVRSSEVVVAYLGSSHASSIGDIGNPGVGGIDWAVTSAGKRSTWGVE